MESVNKIRSALGITREAVGVKYTDASPAVQPDEGRHAVCNGILAAAGGKVVMLSEETCTCPGGKSHIGLTATRQVSVRLLVEGEKLWCDVKTAVRSRIESQKIAAAPLGISSKVYLFPASRDIFVPDLVLFLVNAEQVSRLVTLAQFWDGRTPSFEMRGSLCWGSITYPIVSGNFNVTAGDISARRMAKWDENILVASVPVEKLGGIADAMDRSTAGTARTSREFERMTETITSGTKI
jgi:uncharacterized protein (DUF169 family)